MKGFATYKGFPPGGIATEGEDVCRRRQALEAVPVTAHTIFVESLDKAGRVLQSRERHRGVSRWDHRLSVQPDDAGDRVVWTDEVVIDAGWQTPMVARFAAYTYRYRHKARQAIKISSTIAPAPANV